MVMAIDPEGEFPYFYLEGDVERRLAQHYGCLDTSAQAPSWFADMNCSTNGNLITDADRGKPKRAQFPLGEEGRRRFREARAQWYHEKTGKELSGATHVQVKQAHDASRNERTRN